MHDLSWDLLYVTFVEINCIHNINFSKHQWNIGQMNIPHIFYVEIAVYTLMES